MGDIDDVILLLNAQTLQRLQKVLLGEIMTGREAMLNVFAVADAYITFVLANAKSWSVIIEHSLASNKSLRTGIRRNSIKRSALSIVF